MYGILLSAFNSVLGWVFREAVVKFLIFTVLLLVVQQCAVYLSEYIPGPSSLTGALAGIPSGIWWFLDLLGFSSGAPLVVTAMVYRFLIRRLPFVG